MKFIDEVEIRIASGHGGAGAITFRREAMTPRGGPDGGDGGKGGDLILRTSQHLNSLVDFKSTKKYLAPDGEPGSSANCSGAQGQDLPSARQGRRRQGGWARPLHQVVR